VNSFGFAVNLNNFKINRHSHFFIIGKCDERAFGRVAFDVAYRSNGLVKLLGGEEP
jgi:hypothetical protein